MGLSARALPRGISGRFNQALMELGSLVCTPRSPIARCPAAALCRASQLGAQRKFPTAPEPQTENLREAAVIVWRHGKVLVRQCPPGERWAGLWDFPRVPLSGQRRAKLDLELSEKVRHLVGVEAAIGERLTILKHGVTHFALLSSVTKPSTGAAFRRQASGCQNGYAPPNSPTTPSASPAANLHECLPSRGAA